MEQKTIGQRKNGKGPCDTLNIKQRFLTYILIHINQHVLMYIELNPKR